MQEALLRGGIKTPQAALEVINTSRQRALKIVGVGGALLLLMGGLAPKTIPLVIGMSVFLVVWVVTSTINGQRYIKRYIEEELAFRQSSELSGDK